MFLKLFQCKCHCSAVHKDLAKMNAKLTVWGDTLAHVQRIVQDNCYKIKEIEEAKPKECAKKVKRSKEINDNI